MDHTILLTITVIGTAGWLCAALVVRSSPAHSPGTSGGGLSSFLSAALVAAGMIALGRFGPPRAAPLWTIGLALGTVGGMAAGCISLLSHRRRMSLLGRTATIAAPPFAAIATVAGTLLWVKGPVVEALVTMPVSWIAVSLVLAGHQPRSGGSHQAGLDTRPVRDLGHLFGPAFAVTLAAAAALGVYRASESDGMRWSAAAVTIAAAVPMALLFASAVAALIRREARRGAAAWQAFLSAALLAGVSAALAPRIFGPAPLLSLVAMGLGLGFGLWWVVADTSHPVPQRFSAASQNTRFGTSVAVLLILGAFMAAFSLFAGYGVAIMLLAAWLVLAAAAAAGGPAAEPSPEPDSSLPDHAATIARLAALFALASMLLLFRLITTRFEDDLRGVVLTDHFALVGLLTGAALPGLLTGLLERGAPEHDPWRLARLIVSLAVAAGVPGVMLAVWGPKVALALVAGLALSAVAYHLAGGPTAAARPDAGREVGVAAGWLAPLYALAAAAALTAWMHPIAQLATQSRADRARLLGVALAVLIVAIVACDVAARISAGRRRGSPRAEPSPQGGAG